MADLVAQGADPRDGWRRKLPERTVTLGRVPGEAVEWAAPWDRQISSLHAVLTWDGQRLTVRRSPRGRNPIFFHGLPQNEFTLEVGDAFAIGKTIFTLEGDDAAGPTYGSTPDMELTCSPEELRQVRYIDAEDRVEVLAALPDLIRHSPSDEELEKQVLDVLLRGISRAGAVGVVRMPAPDAAEPEVRARAARFPGLERVPPSRRLIADALRRGQSVLYRWDRKDLRPDITTNAAFDWALCAPLPEAPAPGWGLYVAGRLTGPSAGQGGPANQDLLKSDLKFAEAAAGIFGALRQVRELQTEQMHVRASLRVAQEIQAGFFPRVLPQPPGYEIAAVSRSADETGGDYYDVLPLQSGRYGLVIADVCGHGLGPSLLMASVRAMLRGFSLREPPPEALVSDLNNALHADLSPRHRFITLLYGALDPVAHQFHYANAGHGPVALHLQDAGNTVASLCDDAARGLPLGILKDAYEPCAAVALAPGDVLILGSDGLIETRREGEQFGMGRLTEFLLQQRDRPLSELLDALIEATADFHEHQRHEDDLTLLMVRRK